MAMDSKGKTLTYKGGMYILLALLILIVVGGVITYRFSLLGCGHRLGNSHNPCRAPQSQPPKPQTCE